MGIWRRRMYLAVRHEGGSPGVVWAVERVQQPGVAQILVHREQEAPQVLRRLEVLQDARQEHVGVERRALDRALELPLCAAET